VSTLISQCPSRDHARDGHDLVSPWLGERPHRLNGRSSADATDRAVEICPADIVKRRGMTWDGMAAEVVQVTACERIEFRFRSPLHLLALCNEGIRNEGGTFVEGLPRSTLRDPRRKFTLVPAGHAYHEYQEPRVPARILYFYFDPAKMPVQPGNDAAPAPLAPRLFFEDATLLSTALKLQRSIENTGPHGSPYLEALGVVLAHELVRHNAGFPRTEAPMRGGLAAWQERAVSTYIEEHLAEPIALATLAELARLSPFYFCRAFKQSFGMPPHRYHSNRRMELAKTLLAKPASSVTHVGLALGFSETSSFTAAFRKMTGLTPTDYRRSLI
jgi:AraC family transcriptional regulator